MSRDPIIDGVPTVEIPKTAPEKTPVFAPMRCFCAVKGRALNGDVVPLGVYFEASTTEFPPLPSGWYPSGLPGATPSNTPGQEGRFSETYVLTNIETEGAGKTRWFRAIAEYPPPAGTMGPPTYRVAQVQIDPEGVMQCPMTEVEVVEPAAPSRKLQDVDVDAARGWTLYERLPVDNYPMGSLMFPAATSDEIEVLGIEQRLAVFATDVDWSHMGDGTPTGVYSPGGNGVAAPPNSYFFLPGAPQYCILLWQPAGGEGLPAVFHVVTATRRVDSQVLAFDRRRPIYAQVNDYRGDGYATNSGGFTLAIRQLN